MQELLFVYGTLKRGYCRAFALRDKQFLGTALTAPGYRLVNCGEYPALVEAAAGVRISGELYRIDPEILPVLDELEGVDIGLYRRAKIQLAAPFADRSVTAYLYLRPTESFPDCGTSWP